MDELFVTNEMDTDTMGIRRRGQHRIIHRQPRFRDQNEYKPDIKEIIEMLPNTDPHFLSILIGFKQKILTDLLKQANKQTFECRMKFLETLEKSLRCNATPSCKSNIIQVIVENNEMLEEYMREEGRTSSEKASIKECKTVLDTFLKNTVDIYPALFCKFFKNRNKPNQQEQSDSREKSFRSTEIFLTLDDLKKDFKPNLKPNKIGASYSGVDEYFEVQFRLLHEDLNATLREAIVSMKEETCLNDENAQISRRVKILSPACNIGTSSINIIITSDSTKNRTKRGKHENWLKFGSIVYLTQDDFQTIYAAEVITSENSGRLELNPLHGGNELLKEFGSTFLMIESSVYFRAYSPVLLCLQAITKKDLPFQRYIIECQKYISTPTYINQNPRSCIFDLTCLVDDDKKLPSLARSSLSKVNIFEEEWQYEKFLNLDSSQLKALKSVLSQEICIIQGPPGCGKTFIGLQIAKVLLGNEQNWRRNNEKCGQILVVCYTNHALDHFLEVLCPFLKEDNMIRVGERSTNETVKKYSLKSIRKKYRNECQLPMEIQQILVTAQNEVNSIREELTKEFKNIQILQENIASEDSLREVMEPCQSKQLDELQSKNDPFDENFEYLGKSSMIQWLGIRDMAKTIHQDGYDHNNSHISLRNNVKIDYDECNKDTPEFKQFKPENIALSLDELHEQRKDEDMDDAKKRIEMTRRTLFKLLKRKIETTKPFSQVEEVFEDNITGEHFSIERRWSLYLYWVQRKCSSIYERNADKIKKYEEACLRLKDVKKAEDIFILKKANVIGMTISGAAIHKDMLDEIKPVITIVEEAAQVFESNLVTSLTSGCEHLIMIGDHNQLRPTPKVYRLGKEYNMNISLFERMIQNGMKYQSLETQHRMRPEIANNVRRFYNSLQDHASVKQYDSVKGINHNIFFIDHRENEQSTQEPGYFRNYHEAYCILALCNYLLLQGYDPSKITIITFYNSQLDLLKRKAIRNKSKCQYVDMTTVDGYQGKENDIILLSLVRSNREGNIGFVEDENRMCVALSRAKIGFYIVGNSDCLSRKSKLWKRILHDMKGRGLLGRELDLRCPNHPEDNNNVVTLPKDLEIVCRRICPKAYHDREAYHRCKDLCNVIDWKHHGTKQIESSFRDRREQLPCKKKCRNKCGVKTPRYSDGSTQKSSTLLQQPLLKVEIGSSRKRPASNLPSEEQNTKLLRTAILSKKRKSFEDDKEDNKPSKKQCRSDVDIDEGKKNIDSETMQKNPDIFDDDLGLKTFDSRIVNIKSAAVSAANSYRNFVYPDDKRSTVTIGRIETQYRSKSPHTKGDLSTTRDEVNDEDFDKFGNNISHDLEYSGRKIKYQRSIQKDDLRNKIQKQTKQIGTDLRHILEEKTQNDRRDDYDEDIYFNGELFHVIDSV